MNHRKRILFGLSISFLLTLIIVAGAMAARSPFIGAWEAIDSKDGSYEIMNIGGGPGDSRHVTFRDFGGFVCGEFDPDTGDPVTAATAKGRLQESGNTLSGSLDVYCLAHPPYLVGTFDFEFTYDPAFDTISDILAGELLPVVWDRK